MRRTALTAALASAVVLGPALPATAHPGIDLDPTLPFDVTYASTDNVEHLGRFPEHFGTAGGAPSQDRKTFYLTDPRGVYTYDTSKPEDPVLLDSVPLYQTTTGVALAQEDPNTDGHILLVDAATTPAATGSRLQVVDVSNPKDLKVLSSLQVTDHTWTCVTGVVDEETGETRGCAFAYGRTGHIVDLRDPAAPALMPQTWRESVEYGTRSNSPYTHDLTEVRPGLVITAGASAVVMDTTDPTAPVFLTEIGERDRFSSLGYHSVEWAQEGRNPFVVLGTEIAPPAAPQVPVPGNTAGSDCEGEQSVIETWNASAFLAAMESYEVDRDPTVFEGEMFTKIDAFDASGRGIFLDGKAPASQLYCAHWMELSPEFGDDGGVMAVAYYNRGTRFVDVDKDGTMKEIGWITPAEGYTGSPQWISDSVVYVMDYRRGLEVVKLTQGKAATKVVEKDKDNVAESSTFVPSGGGLGGEHLTWAALALLALGLVKAERVVRRREGALATA